MPDLEKIESLFHHALSIEDAIERRQWLAGRCGADADLLEEVVSLLEAHQEMDSAPASPAAKEAPAIPTELFGAYRASRLVGRGGMSAVYLAERADGRFDTQVAIKVMAAHLAGDDFRRRFSTEGQFLAALRHPHITGLLDGGVSSSGHPYLAMEYVEGAALDEYCDRLKLTIEDRLRLFLQVADAVEYAHRNLILHRDLKPANILVNNDGQAKLLDFGTAGLISGSAITATRSRMLTPRYASPEQLRGQRPGVGGDVFSLGVILYELLTGAWPYGDPESVVCELQRIAAGVSPTRPTTAVTEAAAERRSISRERLRRSLGGDLSAILLKALENEPSRRYPTVRDFARDLQNYLNGRPVEARPQTTVYRFSKFVRRRWVAASVTALLAIAVSVAAVVAALEARTARAEALKVEQVNRFLTDMLAAPDEHRDVGKYTVDQMLEAADQRLESGSIGGPLTLAVLHKSLGNGYIGQQRYDKARFHLDRALPVFRAEHDARNVAETLALDGLLETDVGHYPEADRVFQESLDTFRQMGKSAPVAEVLDTEMRYAQLLSVLMRGHIEQARVLYDDVIGAGMRDSSIPRVTVAAAMANRAMLRIELQKPQETEAAILAALATGRKEEAGGLWETDVLFDLTTLYSRTQDYQKGKETAQRIVDIFTRKLGPDVVRTAQARNAWAGFAVNAGEPSAAAQAVRESMPVIEKAVQSPSLILWYAQRNASNVMRIAGQFAEAESYARQSLGVVEAAHLSNQDPRVANSWEALGRALSLQKKYAEALAALQRAREIYSQGGNYWAKSAHTIQGLIDATRRNLAQDQP